MSADTAKTPKRGRGGALLIASLALNTFLIGLLIGSYVFAARMGVPFGGPDLGFRWDPIELRRVVQDLGPDSRAQMRRTMRRARLDIRQSLAEVGAARAATLETLLAEPFDPAALRARLGDARDAESAARAVAHNAFVDFVNALPAAERRALAEAIASARPDRFSRERRGPGRGFRRNGPGGAQDGD